MKKFLIFAIMFCAAVTAKANLYTADMISVSAEANSAVEARDLALNHAVREAFPMMVRRVSLSDTSNVEATPAEMSAMVQGLSIANEKTTPTKYMADVTVQFKQKDVQDFLNRQGVLYITKEPPKYLLIPIFIEGDKAVLLDEQSPLYQAMKKGISGSTIYEFVTPLGDEDDKQIVTLNLLNGTDLTDLNALLLRYRADYALLVRVTKTGAIYKVQAKSYPENQTGNADVLFAVSSNATNVPAVMTQILKKTAGEMETKWRAGQTALTDQKGDMTVIIPINGLGEWMAIEKQIKSLSFLDQVQVQALHKNQVFVKLKFSGSTDSVVRKMDKAGFHLQNSYDNTWIWDKLGTSEAGPGAAGMNTQMAARSPNRAGAPVKGASTPAVATTPMGVR